MRNLVRDYVRAVHVTYLDHVAHLPPAQRGALPLVAAGNLTVVAAAAQRLHLVATTDLVPASNVDVADHYGDLAWAVRFFDPSVRPELGGLAPDEPADVRRVLGIANAAYHLVVAVGGGLTAHHAWHSGVALANQHGTTLRRATLDDVAR